MWTLMNILFANNLPSAGWRVKAISLRREVEAECQA